MATLDDPPPHFGGSLCTSVETYRSDEYVRTRVRVSVRLSLFKF